MSDSPFRQRRVPPEEVQRVIKRAAELAMMDATPNAAGPALTEAELEARLGELGISPEIAKRALESSTPALPSPSPDGWTRIDRTIEIEGMLPVERFEEIAELLGREMKVAGRATAVGSTLTWTPGGPAQEPSVTIQAKDGVTRIRYRETLANRGQARIGFGVMAGLGGMTAGTFTSLAGVAIAKGAEISAAQGAPFVLGLGALAGIAAAVGSFVGLRRLVERRIVARSAFAEQILARIGKSVKDAVVTSAKRTRIVEDAPEPIEEEIEDPDGTSTKELLRRT